MRAQEVFKHIDEDCGGTIDTDEFTQWWMDQQRMKAFTGKGGQLFNMFEVRFNSILIRFNSTLIRH